MLNKYTLNVQKHHETKVSHFQTKSLFNTNIDLFIDETVFLIMFLTLYRFLIY